MSEFKGRKMKNGWATVGSIRIGENKETKEKYTYMKLEPNVEILVDGERVPLNQYRTLRFEKPTVEVEFLLDKGHIDEAEADKRKEALSGMPWLKYSVKHAPDKKAE